jgi:hypothetical protein
MKLDGVNGAQELLIRGNSDKLDSGDLVGYGGLMMSEDKPGFQVSAHRIRRISNQQGVRTFEIRGTAKAGFVGGPVFGAGNTVVGVITKETPIDDNASVFFAVDVAVIPKIP